MNLRWTSVTSGLIVGGALGFVIGHISALSRVAPAPSIEVAAAASRPDPSFSPAVADVADDIAEEPVYFPEIQRLADSAPDISLPDQPAALPNATDAVPIASGNDAAAIQALIDAELSEATPQQREVWADVLEGLPPEDALGILQLWRRFGGPPDGALATLPTTIPKPPRPMHENVLEPSRRPAGDDATTLREVRAILLGNFLNADSIGYRRIEPLLTDRRFESGRPGVRLTGTRIDPSQGNLINTNRSLDIAIQGAGYFIALDDDRQVYTRCGRLELDDLRRLCIRAGDRNLPLHPEIKLPKDVQSIEIANNGDVSVAVSSGATTRVGSIPLATFLDAHALQSLGDGLLGETSQSGTVQGHPSGDAIILQRVLEQSNVDRAEEQRQLDRIDDLLSRLAGTQ